MLDLILKRNRKSQIPFYNSKYSFWFFFFNTFDDEHCEIVYNDDIQNETCAKSNAWQEKDLFNAHVVHPVHMTSGITESPFKEKVILRFNQLSDKRHRSNEKHNCYLQKNSFNKESTWQRSQLHYRITAILYKNNFFSNVKSMC